MNSKQIIGHIMSVTGESISALAASNGYTKQAFYDVIKGRTKTKHLQELISAITGLPIGQLWPGDSANNSTCHFGPQQPPAPNEAPCSPGLAISETFPRGVP